MTLGVCVCVERIEGCTTSGLELGVKRELRMQICGVT